LFVDDRSLGCIGGINDTGAVMTADTAVYEIVWRHDLGYELDTVKATYTIRSGARYYLKGLNDKDHWSDREPIKLEE